MGSTLLFAGVRAVEKKQVDAAKAAIKEWGEDEFKAFMEEFDASKYWDGTSTSTYEKYVTWHKTNHSPGGRNARIPPKDGETWIKYVEKEYEANASKGWNKVWNDVKDDSSFFSR